MTHLQIDHNDQDGCYGETKALYVVSIHAIGMNAHEHGAVRNEEEDQRAGDAVDYAQHELFPIEQLSFLTSYVQGWIFDGHFFAYVLVTTEVVKIVSFNS